MYMCVRNTSTKDFICYFELGINRYIIYIYIERDIDRWHRLLYDSSFYIIIYHRKWLYDMYIYIYIIYMFEYLHIYIYVYIFIDLYFVDICKYGDAYVYIYT